MSDKTTPKSPQPVTTAPKAAPSDEKTPLEEQAHPFAHRHWVNEACGDDLWDL